MDKSTNSETQMNEPKITTIGESLGCGEGPHWDEKTQCLYYVDIPGHTIFKYNPANELITKCTFPGGTVSFVIPITGASNKFAIGYNRKIAIVTWDGVKPTPSEIEEICEVDHDATGNRFNDAKCDPFGRLYAGTMGRETSIGVVEKKSGSLYLVDLKNKKCKTLLDEISIANGLAWDPSKNKMYYIDSSTYRVDQLDYSPETGEISNRKVVFDFKQSGIPGLPDGMCIDKQGMLWVACFMGGRVIRIDPTTNRLNRTILLPAKQITSVAFGGPNLDTLYVTSAAVEMEKSNPSAGLTFKITRLGDIQGSPGDSAVF